ncbi:MAG: hypothetical protein JSV49_11010 [Thermoplasmata archaeon]|nr:MAG: hypothetical protein JSV49_11010 [Thermoplasmata archaeon]
MIRRGNYIPKEKSTSNNLTKEDLLFLHLLKNNRQRDNYIVTESLTQKGIQKELKCGLGLISRILIKNEKEDYICRKKLRIEDKKRKQNVYFLTDEGLKIAKELEKKR